MKSIAVIEVRKMLTECYEVENYPCFVMAKDTYKEVKKLKPKVLTKKHLKEKAMRDSFFVMPKGITEETSESPYKKQKRRAKELKSYHKRTIEIAKVGGFYEDLAVIDEVL